jgi:alanyl-tRNA synthetase
MDSTRVTYPRGDTSASGRVVLRETLANRDAFAIVTDVTCFHPVDSSWPDQPGDRGLVGALEVVECVTGAIGPEGQLEIGDDIPVRRGDPNWSWVVVHILSGPGSSVPAVGDQVQLVVDDTYRSELSAAHTACHLAALALNQAGAGQWRKDPGRVDSLGNPDLDSLAIQESRISPLKSVDTYRLGKSIRKKGLNSQTLLDRLPELGVQATDQVRTWIQSGADVTISTDGDEGLDARRSWRCQLPEGVAEYPCGGTHLHNLADLPYPVTVTYARTPDGFESVVTLDPPSS